MCMKYRWLFTLVTGMVACSANGAAAPALIKPGAAAPDLVGEDEGGKSVRLSDRRGHPAVVYFYPKDATPGCTKEACAFRDVFEEYKAAQVTVFGVSRDSMASHRAFRKEHALPFPLVADEDGRIERAYGVQSRLGMSARVTFLVASDGTIAHVWPDVDPGVHAKEVLAEVSKLGK